MHKLRELLILRALEAPLSEGLSKVSGVELTLHVLAPCYSTPGLAFLHTGATASASRDFTIDADMLECFPRFSFAETSSSAPVSMAPVNGARLTVDPAHSRRTILDTNSTLPRSSDATLLWARSQARCVAELRARWRPSRPRSDHPAGSARQINPSPNLENVGALDSELDPNPVNGNYSGPVGIDCFGLLSQNCWAELALPSATELFLQFPFMLTTALYAPATKGVEATSEPLVSLPTFLITWSRNRINTISRRNDSEPGETACASSELVREEELELFEAWAHEHFDLISDHFHGHYPTTGTSHMQLWQKRLSNGHMT